MSFASSFAKCRPDEPGPGSRIVQLPFPSTRRTTTAPTKGGRRDAGYPRWIRRTAGAWRLARKRVLTVFTPTRSRAADPLRLWDADRRRRDGEDTASIRPRTLPERGPCRTIRGGCVPDVGRRSDLTGRDDMFCAT